MKKLAYTEKIIGVDGLTVGDFWAWAYSDILSNRNRSIFAEAALGVVDRPRLEWDAVDVRYKNIKIEVKCSAYLQSWKQSRLSLIKFDIAKKKSWDAESNTYSTEITRSAHIYVFCLYSEKDESKKSILDLSKWKFYIVPTNDINEKFKEQKSITITRLEEVCKPVEYTKIKETIDKMIF